MKYLTWKDLLRAGWPTGAPPEAVNDNEPPKAQPDEIDLEIRELEAKIAAFRIRTGR